MKAEQIITSQTPPPRISDNPTFLSCRWCAATDSCHKGAVVEKNCRSCKKAKPIANSEWFCEEHNGVIPKDFIKEACDNYKSINDNV